MACCTCRCGARARRPEDYKPLKSRSSMRATRSPDQGALDRRGVAVVARGVDAVADPRGCRGAQRRRLEGHRVQDVVSREQRPAVRRGLPQRADVATDRRLVVGAGTAGQAGGLDEVSPGGRVGRRGVADDGGVLHRSGPAPVDGEERLGVRRLVGGEPPGHQARSVRGVAPPVNGRDVLGCDGDDGGSRLDRAGRPGDGDAVATRRSRPRRPSRGGPGRRAERPAARAGPACRRAGGRECRAGSCGRGASRTPPTSCRVSSARTPARNGSSTSRRSGPSTPAAVERLGEGLVGSVLDRTRTGRRRAPPSG